MKERATADRLEEPESGLDELEPSETLVEGAADVFETVAVESAEAETASEPAPALPAPAVESESGSAPKPRPSSGRSPALQSLLDLVHDLIIAVVVCVFLITYVVQAFKVQGSSMSPELADGERILVNKFLYRLESIERGDVVVFWYPEDPELSFIKRVVALPGESVEVRDGRVFVDGVLLDEPYVDPENADRRSVAPQQVRPAHYFVLGDNRRGSNDSRSWGLVPERYVYGKAFFRLWPPTELGFVE